MKCGLPLAIASLLVAGVAGSGCGPHHALRELLLIDTLYPINETSVRFAVLEKYPRGTPMAEILRSLRPNGDAPPGLVIRQHERDDIVIESQDAVPRPPGQVSWIVIDLKACEGSLRAVEVYRRCGTL